MNRLYPKQQQKYIAQTTYQWHKMQKTIPAGRPIVSGSGGPKERGHVETQTMQTADCRLQTADCADLSVIFLLVP